MAIVIGLVPALFWGVLPVWIRKFAGGNARQQLLGTTIGIAIVAAALTVVLHLRIDLASAGLFCLSGFCWSFGQGGQYESYERLGVSTTMPLSTALQIIGNSVIGGLVFGEWQGASDVLFSLLALVVLIAGVLLTNGRMQSTGRAADYLLLVGSTIGYWGYSALPHYAHVSSNLNGFLPQALGMLAAALVICMTHPQEIKQLGMVRNISSGLIFSVAAATYLISLSLNGLVNAFVLSQMNVIVATLLGGIVLREFVHGQGPRTAAGLVVLLVGATWLVTI